MSQVQASDVLREWCQSAAYWEKHAQTIRAMFTPVTRALIENAAISEGAKVLDVAAGPGEPSLSIAEIVGPSGSVTCTDLVPAMINAAEREANRRGLANLQFHECSADSLPFEDNTYDAVVCRLGVMFFPDPVVGAREILRVVKPRGWISFAVWGKSDRNPFACVVTNIVSRYTASPPADPNAPGAFRFAEPGALARVLEDAGAQSVNEQLLQFHMEAPISPREFWEMRSQTSGTLRDKLNELPDQQAERVAQEVQAAVREFFPNNQMKFPAEMLVVTGRKEAS